MAYYDNEDDRDDLDGSPQPDSSISSNGPIEGSLSNPAIAQMIASRQRGLGDLSGDPLMKDYEANQGKLNDFRDRQRMVNYITNLGQGAQQAAMGVNAPVVNNHLYANINKQNEDLLSSVQGDMTTRARVINAIEARKSREGVAADNRATREMLGKQHSLDLATRMKEQSGLKQDLMDAKTRDTQDKAYTSMRHDLETFRGNQAVQQAALKVQNADTALAIVKNKDPNTLSTQDLQLLADEMGKIATGGVPSEHGTTALLPNTLMSKVANMQSFLSNKPTDAQAGEFIKHNMVYLEEMKNVAKKSLNSYRTNISRGYKGRVRPEQYDEASKDYGLGTEGPGISTLPDQKIGAASVRMQAPDGTIRLVPDDKVDAAIAAGGKRLQ